MICNVSITVAVSKLNITTAFFTNTANNNQYYDSFKSSFFFDSFLLLFFIVYAQLYGCYTNMSTPEKSSLWILKALHPETQEGNKF